MNETKNAQKAQVHFKLCYFSTFSQLQFSASSSIDSLHFSVYFVLSGAYVVLYQAVVNYQPVFAAVYQDS